MSRRKREAGPVPRTGHLESVATADHSLVPVADDPRDELALLIDGTFVVVVKATGGRYRRRAFLSAAAAEKSAAKATAAGFNATVYLAELRPVWKISGGVS